MKNTSLYSGRFSVIEGIAYFILPVPWLPDLLAGRALPYGDLSLTVKIVLTVAVIAFIALLRDVRKKINSLDILKQTLSMAAIHDLKGPLTSIIGVLSLISEPDIDPVTREKLLTVAGQSSKSMVKLIQNLIDTDRMEVAGSIVQPQELDLRAHMREALAIFDPISEDLGIKLVISVEEGLPAIYADKDLLGRVFENLVMNSFKYSRKGGNIRVSVRQAGGIFYFEVEDAGTGFPPEHIKEVFGKYYSVKGKEDDSRQGSGLGLYFCRLAIEAHGGKIRAESEKGKGTRIFFELPQRSR